MLSCRASLYARGPGACDDFAKLWTAAARPSHKRGVKPPTILQRIQPTSLRHGENNWTDGELKRF